MLQFYICFIFSLVLYSLLTTFILSIYYYIYLPLFYSCLPHNSPFFLFYVWISPHGLWWLSGVTCPLLYKELWVEMTCYFCTENLAISCSILVSLLKKRVTFETVAAQLPWTPDGCSRAGWSLLTVIFNFTCRRDWARWCWDIWSNIVSGCVCEDVSKEKLTLNP